MAAPLNTNDQLNDLVWTLLEATAKDMPEDRFEHNPDDLDNGFIKFTLDESGDLLTKAIQAGGATELRRLADDLNGTHAQPEMNAGLVLAIRKIRDRADQLAGGAK